jgi:hypothetical protein
LNKNKVFMQNLRVFCEITEASSEDLKADLSISTSVVLSWFWTTIFWQPVLKIILKYKIKCVRRETKKKKKKSRKFAHHYMNAMLRNALKKWKTCDALHKCYAFYSIKKVFDWLAISLWQSTSLWTNVHTNRFLWWRREHTR